MMQPPKGKTFCIVHDPSPKAQRANQIARLQAGLLAHGGAVLDGEMVPIPNIQTVPAMKEFIAKHIHDTQTGKISPNVSKAVTAALNTIVALVNLEVDSRLEALEQLIADRMTR